MISRRLLRIKVLQVLYAYFNGKEDGISVYEKELKSSIEKSYDLYLLFFVLLVDVREMAKNKIEAGKGKNVPTKEDLNPNMRFINNRVIKILLSSNNIFRRAEERKLTWLQYPELIKRVYQDMTESEIYGRYMNANENGFKEDRKFIEDFYMNYLLNSDLLYQILEEQSIYWNDDIEFVLGMNIKTIEKIKPTDSEIKLFPLYKNDDDEQFATKLFRSVVLNHTDQSKIIQDSIRNWDIDRIAQMDLLVMEMAISEIMSFPTIPVKVSFNEYIELVKFYSTEKSNAFVNGVLDKLIQKLQSENKIVKTGRGLE